MSDYLLISDAAKEVKVESHVLRYWEEELHLPIKRNELGHRYYTNEDVERFKQIKNMKERGLQLKAIKVILKNGKIDVLPEEGENSVNAAEEIHNPMAIDIVAGRPVQERSPAGTSIITDNGDEKVRRLQWLLQQLIRETLEENNIALCNEIKESIVKELDYQFRNQEEREEERERRQSERSEEYYKKMDELLRSKSASKKLKESKKALDKLEKNMDKKSKKDCKTIDLQSHKKKRHFIF